MAEQLVPFVGDIEVFEAPAAGRGVRCTADIPKGTTILREECLSAVLHQNKIADYCDYCLKRPNPYMEGILRSGLANEGVKKCTRCMVTRYCNKECQVIAWKLYHKKECKSLKTSAGNSPYLDPSSVQTLARLVIQLVNSKEEPAFDDKNFPLTVKQLYCDVSKLMERNPVNLTLLTDAVTQFLGSKFFDANALDSEHICKVGAASRYNSMAIFDDGDNGSGKDGHIGAALYQRASLFNHHCRPNSMRTFNGRWIAIRSVRDLKKGEQVCISYHNKLGTTEDRRATFQERHHFTCRCSLCVDPRSDLVLRCFTCRTENCEGFFKMESEDTAKCTFCARVLPKTDVIWKQIVEEETLMKSIAINAESANDKREVIARFGQFINPRLLHPNHYLVVRAREKFVAALGDCEDWDRVRTLTRENLEPIKYQYPPYDSHVFDAYKKLGDEYGNAENMRDCREMYKQIRDFIQVTHEEKHPLQKVVKDRIDLTTQFFAFEGR